ncbi:MAG: cation diffusion facilitator family transporter [Bacteroidales bacterium]
MGNDSEHHHHHHDHDPLKGMDHVNKAFVWSIVLNSVFLITEFIVGITTDSLALLSDAGHNLGDVFSLLLALLAFRMMRVKPNLHYTYGYKKSSVLVSLINACVLLVTVGVILVESLRKILHPEPVNGDTIALVAGVGVLINGFTAWLFVRDKGKDLNVKGAYLHLAADALVSLGVVVSGIVIRYTGWYVIDPVIGVVIAVVIFLSTWRLLAQSVRLSLDGVPEGFDLPELKKELLEEAPFLEDIHHIHIWALSTTQIAITAHVVLKDPSHWEENKCVLKKLLATHGISHVTLELESDTSCEDPGYVF